MRPAPSSTARPGAESPSQSHRTELAPSWVLLLVAIGVVYRFAAPLLGLPWNTAPILAMAFGGGILLGSRFWWMPVLALIASDLALGLLSPGGGIGWHTLVSTVFYGLAAVLGAASRWRLPIAPTLWAGTMICGVLFYAVANTFTWLALPEYAKSFAGWWQSQTTGLPQYSPPAWVFLRNSLIADTAWSAVALLAWQVLGQERPASERSGNSTATA